MSISQWFSGLRAKLLFMILFPVVVLAVVAAYGYYHLTDVSADLTNASMVEAPVIRAAGDIDSAVNAIIRRVFEVYEATQPGSRTVYMKELRNEIKSFEDSMKTYLSLPHGEKTTEMFKPVIEMWAASKPVVEQIYSELEKSTRQGNQAALGLLNEKIEPDFEKMMTVIEETAEFREKKVKADSEKNVGDAKHAVLFMIVLGLSSITVILVSGFVVATRLANALGSVTRMIGESSSQVASAASQVSDASQQLASSSTEQASAVEETSASLEEMTGMVENTVKYAESGLQTVENVKAVSERGNQSMLNLAQAMSEVMASNERIEKLVKVIDEIGDKTQIIDEIVFQTKLLSFNASVEAERAGEHGRGFAVVAQEVGNLAQMSGKAALEISAIVKSGTKEAQEIASENKARVQKGNEHVQETAEILQEIQKNADTVLTGSRQIQSASKEQSAGIKQISLAMENINKATQETAATSEESASAGEELNAQARQLASLVSEMNTIISGKSESGHPNEQATAAVAVNA